MRRKKTLCAALVIAGLSTIFAMKAYAATAAMPAGTVIIGTKAYALSYANLPANLAEINAAVVAGGEIYVKGFDSVWVNNSTSKIVPATSIPSVTYKDITGIASSYGIGDKLNDTTSTLQVISIE